MQTLARYREPSHLRSIVEIAITIVPLVLLWVAMWLALDIGYGVYLLLAVPSAGFLVRLFMIQHDCGHRSFFRHRLANDWVDRVIGAFTMTPYDCWRRGHAMHHATSGNLERRGVGDIDTLTVHEYLALSRAGRMRYRLYRHPLVMFGVGPIYLFFLPHRLPVGMMRDGWKPWVSTMATNVAIVLFAGVTIWAVGIVPFLLVHLPITVLGSAVGIWLFYVQHPNTRPGIKMKAGTFMRRLCTVAPITTFRQYCAGSQPISACTMCTISAAGFRSTGCRWRCVTSPNWPRLAD